MHPASRIRLGQFDQASFFACEVTDHFPSIEVEISGVQGFETGYSLIFFETANLRNLCEEGNLVCLFFGKNLPSKK